jgi:hypothetical protein
VTQTGRFAGDDERSGRHEHFVNFRGTLTWQRDIGTETRAVRCACFAGSRRLLKVWEGLPGTNSFGPLLGRLSRTI